MADTPPITVALYGFVDEQESIMQAAFANSDKWATPWLVTKTIENASVIIVDVASEDDYGTVGTLARDFPRAEIVAFSAKKPPQTEWHLVRQPGGKVPIVAFSQLVLKISHLLKKSRTKASRYQVEEIAPAIKPNPITETAFVPNLGAGDYDEEGASDFLPFFDALDSLLDKKPHEKRKRFNES